MLVTMRSPDHGQLVDTSGALIEMAMARSLVLLLYMPTKRVLWSNAKATSAVAETLLVAMKPGARIKELQALARATYRTAGVPGPDRAVVFLPWPRALAHGT